VLLMIVTGLMSFALLIVCEGSMNALSHEGCRHFEVFNQADEDFERGIFQVEDPVLKHSVGALYDRMWGPHGRDTVRERSDRAMEQVWSRLCDYVYGCVCVYLYVVLVEWVCCFFRWHVMRRSTTSGA
jgi:hypothetical protein